ncbi:MAG: hypothetical protein LAT84_01335 [Balneolia bacterium]|nr:hypothetical protein [Balneolia bacterium]
MRYLFILDYKNLDNGGFLKLFAKRLSELRLDSFMVLHADSEYTDRIMQTGVMREDAKIRSIKELNLRLTALFADEGIPMIAINGYQRDTVVQKDDESIEINSYYLKKLGTQTNVLLSALVKDTTKNATPKPLADLAEALHSAMEFHHIIAFDTENKLDEIFVNAGSGSVNDAPSMPKELANTSLPLCILRLNNLTNRKNFDNSIG